MVRREESSVSSRNWTKLLEEYATGYRLDDDERATLLLDSSTSAEPSLRMTLEELLDSRSDPGMTLEELPAPSSVALEPLSPPHATRVNATINIAANFFKPFRTFL